MILPIHSQTILRGEIKETVNSNGDTLVIMHLEDARIILDNMYKDDGLTRTWLTTFYTSHLQDNYNGKSKTMMEEFNTNLTEQLKNTYNSNEQ